jgi:hypothetical protein
VKHFKDLDQRASEAVGDLRVVVSLAIKAKARRRHIQTGVAWACVQHFSRMKEEEVAAANSAFSNSLRQGPLRSTTPSRFQTQIGQNWKSYYEISADQRRLCPS